MSSSIVCVEEFLRQYQIPEAVYTRFLPCNNVRVVTKEEFEKFRRSLKREAEEQIENVILKKAQQKSESLYSGMTSLRESDCTTDSLTAVGGQSLTLDCDSFEILESEQLAESSVFLCMSSEIEDGEMAEILQSGDFASEPDLCRSSGLESPG